MTTSGERYTITFLDLPSSPYSKRQKTPLVLARGDTAAPEAVGILLTRFPRLRLSHLIPCMIGQDSYLRLTKDVVPQAQSSPLYGPYAGSQNGDERPGWGTWASTR